MTSRLFSIVFAGTTFITQTGSLDIAAAKPPKPALCP